MCLKRLEPGELHQVSNVRRGKPVLFDARHLHAEPFRERHQWFPQTVVRGHQQSRTPPAERLQVLKRLEHIDCVADLVKQNVVKILVLTEKLEELFRVGKTNGRNRTLDFVPDRSELSRCKYLSPSLYADPPQPGAPPCRNELIRRFFGARRGIEEAG